MNEFLIELQAVLDREKSKGNIDKSIVRMQEQLNKLKLQAELDPKTIFNLKRQIEKATNQSITISNINLNQGQIEKTGQQIGKSLNSGLLTGLASIKNSIYNAIKQFNSNKLSFPDIAKAFNLNRADIDSSVLQHVRDLTKEINSLSKEVMKTGSDSSWDNITNKINSLYSVLNQFGRTRDLVPFRESLNILKQFEGKKIFVNNPSELFQNAGVGIRELNNQFRSLNVTFTTSRKNAIDLDTVWSELCNTSPNLEKFITFGDQVNAIVEHLKVAKQALYSDSSLQPLQGNEVSRMLIGYMDRLAETSNKLGLLREQETELKQNSTSTTDTIVQNEGRKQQAYKQTADIQKQLLAGESLIKSDANIMMFENTNNAAREASQYFKELLQDEQALISVSEKFDKSNALSSFSVNVKRANGEVETLRYALENIGTNSEPLYVFKNIGAEMNNSTAIKQMQQMEKVITDYETKLNGFKTRYSKTSMDFSGFETVFNNFKNGIGTVNDLKLAFNQLENSAKMGVQSLKSQSASLDPIQQAINNLRDMPTMLKNIETNMAGLQNKTGLVSISVDDLTSRYMKLKSEMDAAGGKVPLDGSWAKEYQKLMSDVVSATKRVTAEQKKAEKASHSLFASLKKNFSFLSYWTSASYIFMTSIRKIKEMISSVRELEDALVNINYTMELSGRQLKEIGESSLQMARDMNTSAGNLLSAVKLYSNAKESAQSILDKSKPAVMISNVTGMSGEESAKMLQSVMNQFDMTQDDLMEIADTIEMVSQNMAYDFASGIDEIAKGIEQSGSVAKSAGLSLQEYVSMLGLVIEKTGQSGSTIGNAYKTILQRITKASSTEGTMEEDISAAEKSLRAVGIEVRDTADEFRDLTDIMSDLGKVWNSLSSVEQSNISYNVAGIRQTNILKSLLGYWEDYENLVEKANNASGTTLHNQEIYAESLKGRLGELSAIWSNISNDTISSNFLKGLADAGIGISSLIEKIGLLKTVIASVGIAAFVKNFERLKTIGESVSVLNTVNKVMASTAYLGNGYMDNAVQAHKLSIALNGYSTEAIKAAIAQSTLNAEQIKAILTAKGLTEAEIEEVITTNALTASQTSATASTLGLGTAFKGLGASMKAFALSNPILTAIAAIGVTIYGVVKAYDALTVSVEEANDAMDEAVSEYESAKSSLESINTELEEQNKKIDELLAKDNLTYAEKGQLEELQAITKELLLQQDIEQKRADKASKEAASKTVDAYEKQYGKYDTSREKLKENLEYTKSTGITIIADSENDITGNIAAYIHATEMLTEAQQDYEEALKNGGDTEYLVSDVQDYIDAVDDYSDILDQNISDLQEKRLALEDEYNKAIEKRENGTAPLTSYEQDAIDTYESIHDAMKLIYEYTNKNDWNNMEISNIFNTEGIEKTKEELISMYKSGELSSEKMLEQFPKLNQAIKESELIAGEGSDAFKEFFNEIAALADETEDTVSGILDKDTLLSTITSSIEQIATQLEPQFAKLGDAYKDIFTADGFTLDAVDNSMLEDLRKSFAEIEDEIGVTFDTTQLEDLFAVLSNANSTAEQTQAAFNNIATSYLYSTKVLEDLNSTTVDSVAKQLESLGIVNASEVATQALAVKEEYLAFARREHTDEAGNLVSVTQDLTNATADDINVLIAEQDALEGEGIALDETTQKIIAYWIQKQAANGQLSTVGDIQQLGALCEALGVSSAALRNYIYFKKLASMTDVYDAASIERFSENAQKHMEQAQADIQSIYSKLGGAEISFAAPDTSKKSSSKSEKDTTKEIDWIEQAIENVEKEVNNLDDTVNSAYSTLSQKNTALAQEIGKVSEEIRLQQQAYDTYMQKAESIGLSDEYKTLIRDGAINIENISDENLQKKISDYQQWYEKAVDASEAISELSSRVKDLHVKGYELQAERLEELLDNETITEKQYISEMTKLYKQYYENQTEYAVQAHEAKLALLNREKEYLNSVASAAASLLDREIDRIQDNADAQTKPYQDRIKEAEKQVDVYEKQIDVFEKQIDGYNKEIDLINDRKKPLEDELDALEDKAREENLILDLQKKQYELKRAENQRDKLVYKDGQMIYDGDPAAVRDAKKEVEDAELEIQKNDIQKQIDALDEEIEKYNELIDAINDQIDAVNDQIDAVNDYIDGLNDIVDQINDAADAQIEALEKTKNKWQEVIDQQEEAQNMLLLTGEFGADAIRKILSGNDDNLLAQWKESYITTLSEIDSETQGYIGDMTTQLASLYGVDLSPLKAQFNTVKESVDGMMGSLGNVVKAIAGKGIEIATGGNQDSAQSTTPNANVQGAATGSLADAFTQVGKTANKVIGNTGAEGDGTVIGEFGSMKTAVNDVSDALSADDDSLETAILDETETALDAFDQHTEKLTGEVTPAIQSATQEMNVFNDAADKDIEKTVTIRYETTGEKPSPASNITVGKAHADGTAGKAFADGDSGLKHDEKNALRSEYGQPELTVYPNGEYELTDTPTMSDLPKGTVIYNEEQTKKIMDNKSHVQGKTYANGTVEYPDGTIITPDGHTLRPLQPGDRGWDLMQKFQPLVDKVLNGEMEIVSNAVFEHQRNMEKIVNQLTNNTIVTNSMKNIQPSVNFGDINITCPGVTDPEVMRNLHRIVKDEFFGLYAQAYQQVMRTR